MSNILRPDKLSDEAELEVYQYIDKKIRTLPRKPEGMFNTGDQAFHGNDVDALRHAYVSGVFTQVYGENVADIFGRVNEIIPYLSKSHHAGADTNMDLWNNAVGRSYGLKTKNRNELLKLLHKALEKEELITTPSDSRRYNGAAVYEIDECSRIVVLKESPTGRNEIFYDMVKREGMTCEQFVAKIKAGEYSSFRIAAIGGAETPISKKDGKVNNNLG